MDCGLRGLAIWNRGRVVMRPPMTRNTCLSDGRSSRLRSTWCRLMTLALAATTIAAAATFSVGVASANPAAATIVTRPTQYAGVVGSHTSSSPNYTPGELYGGTNPVAVCFTCEASDVTGLAPPSESLDAGSGVDALTGDFTTSQTYFDVPSMGGDLSFTLSYDAQLAQAERTAGSPGSLGYGWTSNLDSSITAQSPYGGTTNQLVVNQGNDSQITFTQSAGSSCPSGDQTSTARYTVSNIFTSSHNWCALANVQAQVGDDQGLYLAYEQDGGRNVDLYYWNGTLDESGSYQAITGLSAAPMAVYYDIPPGSGAPDYTQYNQICPLNAPSSCNIFVSSDGRSIVESINPSTGLVYDLIDPSGEWYEFDYDAHSNLSDAIKYENNLWSEWSFVYDTSQPSPYSSDLIQIYDPDSGKGYGARYSPGATHSVSITYNHSGANVGMVGSVEDGTGATTTYSYQSACTQGQCVGATATQQTTVTYPAQVPCPNCTVQSPVEVDSYTAGVETATSLGSTSDTYDNEVWQYNWTMGFGASNSTEVVTYPHSLNGSALTATFTLDPAGNVIKTVNALGDTATSAYNDIGGNTLPELLWSFPGPSNDGPSNPPAGSEVYTYDQYGNVLTATDPLGNVTGYGYYPQSGLMCAFEPPTTTKGSDCTGTGYPPTGGAECSGDGCTIYSYDTFGDATYEQVDWGGTSQITTATYNVMGGQLCLIPPTGFGAGQCPTNSYGTVTTYTAANFPLKVTKPGQGVTTYSYDAALNMVSEQTPVTNVYITTVYDGDNRACYQLTGSNQSGLTCASSAQAGSTRTSYVAGSSMVAQSTDAKGENTSYYYGDLAYPGSPTEIVDPAVQVVQYTAYDDYGNVCARGPVAPALGTSAQCATLAGDTTNVYNALASMTSMTDPSGNTTTYAHVNAAFPTLVTSETNALNAVTSFSYDADGRQVTSTNPDATAVSTAYDADGRVCAQSFTVTLTSCTSSVGISGVTTFGYDGANERTSALQYLTTPTSQVSAGDYHACSLSNGGVSCWGLNTYGELGIGSTTNSTSPMAVPGLSGVTQVSAGDYHTCALTGSGGVYCWGENAYGQLGNGTTNQSSVPVSVTGLSNVTEIGSGVQYSCALLSSGAVDCWGENGSGQLGDGTTTNSSTPVQVSGVSGATSIGVGGSTACAIVASGMVKCWGWNANGQLGDGSVGGQSTTPVLVSGLSGAVQVAGGGFHFCALLTGGTADCWGRNSEGELGIGSFSNDSDVPVVVSGLNGAVQLAAGAYHTCAVLTGGSLECWGDNSDGELGNGTKTSADIPVQVSSVAGATSVGGGTYFTCATMTAGGVDCWGTDSDGQLANGTTTAQLTPSDAAAVTSYRNSRGQLLSDTDSNGKTVSYLYNYAGQVQCVTYPVSATTSCGTIASPATGSTTNTIETHTYDTAGRLTSVKDWLGNTISYGYGDSWIPFMPTTITYPSSTGVTTTYGFDADGNLTLLAAGSSISDSWTFDADSRVSTATINGAASAAAGYNANDQMIAAANLANSTSNDAYAIAANGEITSDTSPSSAVTSFGYNAGGELCWDANVTASTSACGSPPSGSTASTAFTYSGNGQRASAATTTSSGTTTSDYAWNPLGELCNTASTVVACGGAVTKGTSYTYNADGLRVTGVTAASGATTTTDSTWDIISGGSTPLNINDASSASGATSNTSYLYGNLLFGGTAPVEQITTSSSGSTAAFLVSNQTGVQGVFSSTGTLMEKALYSAYGVQTIQTGSKVTPFGFQGTYADSTGLIYLVNRYYDPATDQFLVHRPAGRPDWPAICVHRRQSAELNGPIGIDDKWHRICNVQQSAKRKRIESTRVQWSNSGRKTRRGRDRHPADR